MHVINIIYRVLGSAMEELGYYWVSESNTMQVVGCCF